MVHQMRGTHFLNFEQTLDVRFCPFLFRLFLKLIRFDIVIKLATLPIGTVQVGVKILALLGPIIRRDVRLVQKFVTAVRKRTFIAELAFPIDLPIPAHFSFEFLLKITL